MYQGLATKFPVDRPLTPQDEKYHLRQDERLELKPYADLVTIKLNSTYLEVVDKFFAMKGQITGFIGSVLLCALVWVCLIWTESTQNPLLEDHVFEWSMSLGVVMLCAFGLYAISKEAFAYTHYPIRLNRKTREVHVFRLDGSVLTVPWGEVFFTLDFQPDVSGRVWEIRGHVLEADRRTVRETFGLGMQSSGDAEGLHILRSHWEFYRRYMEEGPQAVADCVKVCMPVDGRREPFIAGSRCIFSHFDRLKQHPIGAVFWLLMLPLNLLSVLGRWVAMQTSKIPQWPTEIEAVNRIEPDDPCVIDERINPPKLRR